jgi:transposase InsO family protein
LTIIYDQSKTPVLRRPIESAEYTAAATGAACQALGIVQSMGRVGSALDNAAAESFNSTLKVEFVHRHRFATRAEARIRVATWIADFYNTTRRHSANDGWAPIPFEHQMAQARAASTTQVSPQVA